MNVDEPYHAYCVLQLNKCLVRSPAAGGESTQPVAQIFWENKYRHSDYVFDWTSIWKCVYMVTKEPRVQTQQWKLMHNIWPTNILLYRMGRVTSVSCKYCPGKKDYIEHFFCSCYCVLPLWRMVEHMCSGIENKIVKLKEQDILFGYHVNTLSRYRVQNQLILVGKLCISKYKFGNHPNICYLFDSECKMRKLE